MSQATLFGNEPVVPRSPYGGHVPQHRHARDTESAAAERMAPKASKLRGKVLGWVRAAGDNGLTAKEASRRYAAETDRDPNDSVCRNSIAPRLTELAQAGLIRDGGDRRERSIAWVATEQVGDGEEL